MKPASSSLDARMGARVATSCNAPHGLVVTAYSARLSADRHVRVASLPPEMACKSNLTLGWQYPHPQRRPVPRATGAADAGRQPAHGDVGVRGRAH